MAVPPDLAAWLRELSLEAHGARLVADHGIAFLRDVRHLEEQELVSSVLKKLEAKRFVAAAAKLGATQRKPRRIRRPAARCTRARARAGGGHQRVWQSGTGAPGQRRI